MDLYTFDFKEYDDCTKATNKLYEQFNGYNGWRAYSSYCVIIDDSISDYRKAYQICKTYNGEER